MSLGHFNHCVDNSAGIRSIHRIAEQPVLASYRKRPDGILAGLSSYVNKPAYP
jgi:hypothetical protein